MVEAIKEMVCKHCKRLIEKDVKIIGLEIICSYCGKPCEDIDRVRD